MKDERFFLTFNAQPNKQIIMGKHVLGPTTMQRDTSVLPYMSCMRIGRAARYCPLPYREAYYST